MKKVKDLKTYSLLKAAKKLTEKQISKQVDRYKKGLDKLNKDISSYNNMDVDEAQELIAEGVNPKGVRKSFLFQYKYVLKWMNKKGLKIK